MTYYYSTFVACILGCILSVQVLADSPDLEYREFSRSVNTLLIDGNIDSLDSLAETLRTNSTRFKDGRWKLTAFYEGMHPASRNTQNALWDTHEILIKQWIEKTGNNSPTPHIALASFYVAKAWKYRGNGYADTVTTAGREGWNANLLLAENTLNSSAKIGKKCPHWYNVMQDVALGENWDDVDYEALFKEAVAREQTYYFYYFSKANFYQSRWHGSKEKIMCFVDESVKNTFDRQAYTLYARIYWSAQREFGKYMFQPGNVDWTKMKSGFEFINKQYPNSIWNQNAYAHFACLARDKKTTANALKTILKDINLGAWSSPQEFEYCKIWALGEKD